jgi:hypothetical protein
VLINLLNVVSVCVISQGILFSNLLELTGVDQLISTKGLISLELAKICQINLELAKSV